ncbi:DNA adenine methylase [Alicyclobacillus sp. SO9]|uniref:DNA adenine methylase n=1 Tax=Alicyclobacillus sp. SO9 TaxID=2665646 RepID=UPI001E5D384C|nr:DNA adenine methylase [Alicyclobacillus sp. SO9]
MAVKKYLQPFLKWAGGKRQLLSDIREQAPKDYHTYFEPFVGGGAVLFDLHPAQAVINDVNEELVNAYTVIRDDVESLLEDLAKHENNKAYFYALRELDRKSDYTRLSAVERASRLIYLNKTCYNGLFRVNSQGQFNVPFGDYKKPNIKNEKTLLAVHEYLLSSNVSVMNTDFADAVKDAVAGDFVYFDPPYDPVSDTSSFTGYSLGGFGKMEQIRLKETVDELSRRGCKVMLSNSATQFIKDLYKDYRQVFVDAKRAINSNAAKRGKIDEILVMNYGPQ